MRSGPDWRVGLVSETTILCQVVRFLPFEPTLIALDTGVDRIGAISIVDVQERLASTR
jgi:hypothetical protein